MRRAFSSATPISSPVARRSGIVSGGSSHSCSNMRSSVPTAAPRNRNGTATTCRHAGPERSIEKRSSAPHRWLFTQSASGLRAWSQRLHQNVIAPAPLRPMAAGRPTAMPGSRWTPSAATTRTAPAVAPAMPTTASSIGDNAASSSGTGVSIGAVVPTPASTAEDRAADARSATGLLVVRARPACCDMTMSLLLMQTMRCPCFSRIRRLARTPAPSGQNYGASLCVAQGTRDCTAIARVTHPEYPRLPRGGYRHRTPTLP